MKWIKKLEEKQKRELQRLSKRQRHIGMMIGVAVGFAAGACAVMCLLDADLEEIKESAMLKLDTLKCDEE